MKLEKLRNELENKIKELILEVLKDFDMSKYWNGIKIKYHYTDIVFIDENNEYKIRIFYPYYKDEVRINWEENNKIDIRLYYKDKRLIDYQLESVCVDSDRGYYEDVKFYSAEDIIKFLDSELIQIVKTLHENKALLETEIKNILE